MSRRLGPVRNSAAFAFLGNGDRRTGLFFMASCSGQGAVDLVGSDYVRCSADVGGVCRLDYHPACHGLDEGLGRKASGQGQIGSQLRREENRTMTILMGPIRAVGEVGRGVARAVVFWIGFIICLAYAAFKRDKFISRPWEKRNRRSSSSPKSSS